MYLKTDFFFFLMEYTIQNTWRPVIQSRDLGQRGTGSTGSAVFGWCDPGRCSSLSTPPFPHLWNELDRRLVRLRMKLDHAAQARCLNTGIPGWASFIVIPHCSCPSSANGKSGSPQMAQAQLSLQPQRGPHRLKS